MQENSMPALREKEGAGWRMFYNNIIYIIHFGSWKTSGSHLRWVGIPSLQTKQNR